MKSEKSFSIKIKFSFKKCYFSRVHSLGAFLACLIIAPFLDNQKTEEHDLCNNENISEVSDLEPAENISIVTPFVLVGIAILSVSMHMFYLYKINIISNISSGVDDISSKGNSK